MPKRRDVTLQLIVNASAPWAHYLQRLILCSEAAMGVQNLELGRAQHPEPKAVSEYVAIEPDNPYSLPLAHRRKSGTFHRSKAGSICSLPPGFSAPSQYDPMIIVDAPESKWQEDEPFYGTEFLRGTSSTDSGRRRPAEVPADDPSNTTVTTTTTTESVTATTGARGEPAASPNEQDIRLLQNASNHSPEDFNSPLESLQNFWNKLLYSFSNFKFPLE